MSEQIARYEDQKNICGSSMSGMSKNTKNGLSATQLFGGIQTIQRTQTVKVPKAPADMVEES